MVLVYMRLVQSIVVSKLRKSFLINSALGTLCHFCRIRFMTEKSCMHYCSWSLAVPMLKGKSTAMWKILFAVSTMICKSFFAITKKSIILYVMTFRIFIGTHPIQWTSLGKTTSIHQRIHPTIWVKSILIIIHHHWRQNIVLLTITQI